MIPLRRLVHKEGLYLHVLFFIVLLQEFLIFIFSWFYEHIFIFLLKMFVFY